MKRRLDAISFADIKLEWANTADHVRTIVSIRRKFGEAAMIFDNSS